jgi:acetyltransferase
VAAIPGGVDLAILCVPAAAVPAAVSDAAAAGALACVVCTGGMGEAGEDGSVAQEAAAAAARAHGMRLLGPNTSGFLVPERRLFASFVPGAATIRSGPVAVVAQSGGVSHAVAFLLANRGRGVSVAVGLGNAADVDAADVLDYLTEDPTTRCVALHLEGVRDGRRLIESVERATERLPVVVLKVGRSDVNRFAQSHTGAMLGSYRLTRSALRQAGAVVVDDIDELVDGATALSHLRLAPGDPGVGLITGQAGPALLMADALSAGGIRLPELMPETVERLAELLPPITFQSNPVDTGRPGPTFPGVVREVGCDPAIELVCVYALHEPQAIDPRALLTGPDRPPLVFVSGGPQLAMDETIADLEREGVPVCSSPAGGVRAVGAVVEDARGQLRRTRQRELTTASATADLRALAGDEVATKRLLADWGLAVPMAHVCAGRREAHEAFARMDKPIVVKTADPSILHKTERGAVRLGISDDHELDRALDAMDRASSLGRYLLEVMAADGVDLIVGAIRDESFGPTVLLGLGGLAAEALEDVAVRAAPVHADDVAEMVDELTGASLLSGFRGLPAADPEALAHAVGVVGRLISEHPEISEIEINPLRVTEQGLIVLDALIAVPGKGGVRPLEASRARRSLPA